MVSGCAHFSTAIRCWVRVGFVRLTMHNTACQVLSESCAMIPVSCLCSQQSLAMRYMNATLHVHRHQLMRLDMALQRHQASSGTPCDHWQVLACS